MVEHQLPKLRVASSSLVSRFKQQSQIERPLSGRCCFHLPAIYHGRSLDVFRRRRGLIHTWFSDDESYTAGLNEEGFVFPFRALESVAPDHECAEAVRPVAANEELH